MPSKNQRTLGMDQFKVGDIDTLLYALSPILSDEHPTNEFTRFGKIDDALPSIILEQTMLSL